MEVNMLSLASEYGGPKGDQVKRLEAENTRLCAITSSI
jgi:hypothetical protein